MPPLSGWMLLELGLGDGLNSSIFGDPSDGGTAAAKSSLLSMQKRFGKVRQRAVALASKATINAVTTDSCALGGTVQVNDDGVRADGTGVVVFTFASCTEGDAITLNGVVRVTVAVVDIFTQQPLDFTFNFEGVRISSGNASIDAGGTLRTVVTGSVATTTRNTIAHYLPENVYLRLQDFVTIENNSGAAQAVAVSGRFYHSQYGYVDVQTSEPVGIDPWGAPSSGRMVLTGASGVRVDLRFREQNMLSISVDVNGDGVPERGLGASPSSLLQPTPNFGPFADAGPDITVDEGQQVTLDGSRSRDWEGASLAYNWSVSLAPFNAGSFPSGNGATYAFTPTVPGTYMMQLAVSDGTLSGMDRVTIQVRDIPGPLAYAGPDVSGIERSSVMLDASGTTHPSRPIDTLQFTWTRVTAPAGSSAPTTLSGMRPQVAIDLPGTYEYRLTVSGPGGTSTDAVRIVAARAVSASDGVFTVGASTSISQTTFQMPIRVHASYTGAPLALAISSDAAWLTIDTPNVTTAAASVTVRLDLDELETLANGSYNGIVRIAPAGGYTEWIGTFSLHLQLPFVRQVSPYVVYTGQPTTLNLLGDQLHQAAGRIRVDGTPTQNFTRASLAKARVDLPALAAGEYTVSATNELGIERPGARLVVRDSPAHPDDEVTFPGRPTTIEYDAERDVFYGVFLTDASTYIARRFHRLSSGTWQFDPIVVPNPRALTLALGGERLLVTTGVCGVYEVDPVTLQALLATDLPNCYYQDFGLIAALAHGDVLIANTNQWSSVWRYPGFVQDYQLLPSVHTPVGVVSHDRSRMLWAESPTISPPNELHLFDVLGTPADATPLSSPVVVNDSGTYFLRANLAISGDGSRFMHRGDVYNGNRQYVGSLQGAGGPYLTPAVSRQGTRAVVYDSDSDELTLFDISTGNSFPALGVIDTLPEEVQSLQLGYHPDDAAVWMWGAVRMGNPSNPTWEYRLFVREVP